jgi:integrase
VFETERGGSLSVDVMQYIARAAGEAAGLGDAIHPHMLRHGADQRWRGCAAGPVVSRARQHIIHGSGEHADRPEKRVITHHRRNGTGIDTRIIVNGGIVMDPPGSRSRWKKLTKQRDRAT